VSRFRVIDHLDLDEDGEPISSCVLEEINPPKAAKANPKTPKPLSPMANKFWEAFNNVGATAAMPRPESNNRLSITEDQWIAELVRRGLINPLPDEADKAILRIARNRRDAMLSKYRRELISADHIACNGKILWSIRKAT
jgi:hypothetical protein